MPFVPRFALCLIALPLVTHAMGSRIETPVLTGVTCAVVAVEDAGSTVYRGRITPDVAMEGSYAIEVQQTSGSLTASSSTSGSFSAAAGETVSVGRISLGTVTVNGGEDTMVEALMSITVGEASMDCPMAVAGDA
jgi:hypothetical protein